MWARVCFFLGVFSYYIYNLLPDDYSIILQIFSFLIYIAYGCIAKEAYNVWSFIILWFLFITLLKASKKWGRRYKRNSILQFVSQSTFMTYLLHYSIIDLIFNYSIIENKTFKFYAGIFISLIISFSMYYIFGYKKFLTSILKIIFSNKLRDEKGV